MADLQTKKMNDESITALPADLLGLSLVFDPVTGEAYNAPVLTDALKTKLDGIAAGATTNATDAQLRDRNTHTGSQAISTVTGLQAALNATTNAASLTTGTLADARLSGNVPIKVGGKIVAADLPSYVDDVIEVANMAALPTTGVTGIIYVLADSNLTYRWSGSAYTQVDGPTTDAGMLSSGTLNDARLSGNVTKAGNTFNTANKLVQLDGTGKLPALDGSQLTGLPSGTSSVNSVAGRTGDVTLTKSDVSLSNVDNTSDATKNTVTATLTNKTISGSNNTFSNVPDNAVISSVQILTDGSTITWNYSASSNATITLAGNRTLAITNVAVGYGTLVVKQDATGSRALVLPANSKVANNGNGSVTLTSTANGVDVLSFYYDGTNYWWTYGLNFT